MFARFNILVAGAAMLAGTLLAINAEGQLIRPRRVVPVQPAPANPAQVQPLQVQPAPGQAVPDQGTQPNQVPATGVAPAGAQLQSGTETRFLHGRSLIGMNIWDSNRQALGTVKDFLVDYQGDCPTIFFAVAPQITGWSGDYVIVPFSAFQVGFDPQQRIGYFTLNMTAADLGRAPRLAVDKWNAAQDIRPFADARQFYQRVERTAARPQTGGRDERPSLPANGQRPGEGGTQQPTPQQPQERSPSQGQPPAAGQTPAKQPSEAPKPAAGANPDERKDSDASRRPDSPKEPNPNRENPGSDHHENPPLTR